MRRWLVIAPVVVFVALVGMMALRLDQARHGKSATLVPSVLIGKPAPDFALPSLFAGTPGVTSRDLKGHITLLNFFASWCMECRIEHPFLSRIAIPGVTLIGVVYKDKPEAARAWIGRHGNPYQALAVDEDGRAGLDFGVYGVPETYVIDGGGIVRARVAGALTPESIENDLVPLLKSLSGAVDNGVAKGLVVP